MRSLMRALSALLDLLALFKGPTAYGKRQVRKGAFRWIRRNLR